MSAALTFLRSAWILFETHLFRTLRSKRLLAMGALAVLPVVMGLLATATARAEHQPIILSHISWFLLLMLITPLLSLIAGAGVVSEEVVDRTLTFVFTRPVSRAGFFLGRLAAALVAVCLVLAAASSLMFVGGLSGIAEFFGRESAPAELFAGMPGLTLQTVLLGGVVYTTLFAAIGTLVRRPMVVGVGYSMVFEGLLANLPGRTAHLSMLHHLRSRMVALGGDIWTEPAGSVQANFETASESLENLMLTFALSLVFAMVVISRKQYVQTA